MDARSRAESRILLEETIPQAVKKILRVHLRTILASEKGTRKGDDIEKLHEMRVAVRRMRTALRIFGKFLDSDEFDPYVRELRTVGRTLGPVRDLDVWIASARSFTEILPLRARLDLDVVLQEWQRKRARLRERTIDYLESARYLRFKSDFPVFLGDPVAGVVVGPTRGGRIRPVALRHVGPVILHERLAAVRAYEGWMDGEDIPLRRYHRLRIEVKRLRYTLEFLVDVTGPEAELLITPLKHLQDHLGDLRETRMTSVYLEKAMKTDGAKDGKVRQHPGIAAYLASKKAHGTELVESFPSVWSAIRNPEFNRRLAALAAAF